MDGSHPAGFDEAPMTFLAAAPALAPAAALTSALAPALSEGTRFRVRSLRLAPGETTSLRSHLHRSAHWIVVEGTAEITVGIRARLVCEGEAIHVPLGERHRLGNPGRLPVTLIAVETGGYLGEDDVLSHD